MAVSNKPLDETRHINRYGNRETPPSLLVQMDGNHVEMIRKSLSGFAFTHIRLVGEILIHINRSGLL